MLSWEFVSLCRDELVLLSAAFFLLGAVDEIAVDLTYIFLKLRGKISTPRMDEASLVARDLSGIGAVFIPAWQESAVIEATIGHAARAWPQPAVWFFIGCYRNDPATIAAARRAAESDARIVVVVGDAEGPTCKADCLNTLFDALEQREAAQGTQARFVILQDAEDMVDPAAIALVDRALDECDFVQLPVLALPQPQSIWVAGHYSDEFAEAHGKTMVIRHALGAAIPGAGVGCAIARPMLDVLSREGEGSGPFARGVLTEDYELGLTVGRLGGRGCFVRARTSDGRLIATRAYFPADRRAAVRQKTRWLHGIALQGWDRLGWGGGPVDLWMQLRDRRGPLAALLLAIAYILILVGGIELGLTLAGFDVWRAPSIELQILLLLNLLALIWRAMWRATFTAREFGFAMGALAVPRIVVSNTIAILAGQRAVWAYIASLRGAPFSWDKTDHPHHPTLRIVSR